jgi:septal ring factor EnvC (AmiA/AmiB activator)
MRSLSFIGYRVWPWVVLYVLICVEPAYTQTRDELEKQKGKAQKEIEYTNRLLEETRKSKQTTLSSVRIIDKRIYLRNQLLAAINQEITMINTDIEEKHILISDLENDVKKIKDQYGALIEYAYWNKNKYDRLMFILSADNFNMAYKRMKYIQQYTRHRKEQALLIKSLQQELISEIEKLKERIVRKEELASEKKSENEVLVQEKRVKSRMINELSSREEDLLEKIEEKKRIASRLDREISAIIAAEASRDRSRNMYDQLTPEEKLISDNFQGNKGKLPWPTERGVVTSRFGKNQHPVLKQITIQNDGIDISTVQGAEARALFDGVVSKVVAILGANYTVIVRHGNFLTVYQNLVNVRVKRGEEVRVKQVLGTVYTEEESNSTMLHIEIWKELNKQNPEDWLSRR